MKLVLTAAFVALITLSTTGADAGKHGKHTVKPGESIAEIARFHGVNQQVLLDTNGLGAKDQLHPGDVLVVPDILLDGWTKGHVVKPGDTISKIARRYKVKKGALKRINKIGPKGKLKIGRRLVIPKGKQLDPSGISIVGKESKGETKAKKKTWNGKVTFVRPKDNERKTVTMFDKRGRVRKYAQQMVTRVSRSKKNKVRRIHPRLVGLLGKVAKHYSGKDIVIVSGYRPHKRGKKKRSQHSKGRAVDFKVQDVPNLDLYNFIRQFKKVGAGYYPNSTFVHLDVRDKKYLWTDVSGPGEPARYLKSSNLGTAESQVEDGLAGQPDPENFPEE